MTQTPFASLHAGMMERGLARQSYNSGKVVRAILPPPQTGAETEPLLPIGYRRASAKTPPIRALLDQVGVSTATGDRCVAMKVSDK